MEILSKSLVSSITFARAAALGFGTRGLSSDTLMLRYPALLTLKHSLRARVASAASGSFCRGRSEPPAAPSPPQGGAARLERCQQKIAAPKLSWGAKVLGLWSSRVMQGPSGRASAAARAPGARGRCGGVASLKRPGRSLESA